MKYIGIFTIYILMQYCILSYYVKVKGLKLLDKTITEGKGSFTLNICKFTSYLMSLNMLFTLIGSVIIKTSGIEVVGYVEIVRNQGVIISMLYASVLMMYTVFNLIAWLVPISSVLIEGRLGMEHTNEYDKILNGFRFNGLMVVLILLVGYFILKI